MPVTFLTNEDEKKFVKSVNGSTPNENGDVEIEIPEGFSGSWNDLTDKPFGEEVTETKVDTLVKTAPDEINNDEKWKFSDDVPTLEDMSNGLSVIVTNPESYRREYTSDMYGLPLASDDGIVFFTVDWTMYVAPFDGAVVYGITFPTAGIYFDEPGFIAGDIVSLTIAGYQLTQKEVVIEPLDEKYIPSTIARTEDIPELTTETWTFELADGSTVTKQVVVK